MKAIDHIGDRIQKENFDDVSIEIVAAWIVEVCGKESNLVWELIIESELRTCFSDYTNARYNIYDRNWDFTSFSILCFFLPIALFRNLCYMFGMLYMYQYITVLLKYIYVTKFVSTSSFQWKDNYKQKRADWYKKVVDLDTLTTYYTNSSY